MNPLVPLAAGLGAGVLLGVGAARLGPRIAPAMGRAARPAVKRVMKAGLIAWALGRAGASEAADALAEVGWRVRRYCKSPT